MLEPVTLHEAFAAAAGRLREAGLETPELDARLLLCDAAGLTHEAYIARGGDMLRAESAARLDAAIARRIAHEPVSRITGAREFYGREFLVGPETLDPRPDSETLVEAALDIAAARGGRSAPIKLLDLGTGTGCILITLLAELSASRGVGTDISQGALAAGRRNAERLGVAGRASFVAADWLDGIEGQFDLIVSNPPYIPTEEIEGLAPDVAAYDPRLALDGGPDGLGAYRRIAAGAGSTLAAGGKLLVEIGATQGEEVVGIFRAAGLKLREIKEDLAGRPRAVVAER
jgi:release factor glutamine methyltransferase